MIFFQFFYPTLIFRYKNEYLPTRRLHCCLILFMSCKWWFSHFHSVLPRDQHRVTCASSIIHNFYYYLHTFNQGLEEDRLRPHCSSGGTFLNFQFKSLHSIVTLFTFPLFLCTPSHNKQQHPPHNTTAISPFLHFTPTSDLPPPPLHHCRDVIVRHFIIHISSGLYRILTHPHRYSSVPIYYGYPQQFDGERRALKFSKLF